MPDSSSEVQSAQEIEALAQTLLRLELRNPIPAAAIGGPIVLAHGIDTAVETLRRAEIEAALGLERHAQCSEVICAAASEVFAAVHAHLAPFVNLDAPVPSHTYAWRLQVMAKRATLDVVGSCSAARAIQEEAVGEPPLTLCFGHDYRVAFEAALGVQGLAASKLRELASAAAAQDQIRRLPAVGWTHGDGCHCVYLESHSPYRLFKVYCGRCAPGSGNRQRALERNFRPGGRYVEGPARCACGKEFARTRSNQTRCPDCRHHHRVRIASHRRATPTKDVVEPAQRRPG